MGRQMTLLDTDDPTAPDFDPFTASIDGSGMILSVTGHRFQKIVNHNGVAVPTRTPPPSTPEENEQLVYGRLCGYAKITLEDLWIKPELVYIGMALGFDQATAFACVRLKIPFVACVPFNTHSKTWTGAHQTHYYWLLKQASQVVHTSEGGYANWKYLHRDKYMVDRATHLLAFWNGMRNGGTYQTVRMAEKKPIGIGNCWQPWARTIYKDTQDVPHQVRIRQLASSQTQPAQAGQSSSARREWRFY